MLILEKLSIYGETEKDKFSGEIEFKNGFNVINTENGFGKSLIYTGILWSLGLELYLGGRTANDESVWSDGVLDSAKIEGGITGNVKSSYSRLVLKDTNNRTITLTRAIKGADKAIIECRILDSNKKEEIIHLKAGEFQNENISLTRNIFTWAGINTETVYSRKGRSKLYLDHLSSLFFVNQKTGWSDLYADQIRKFGIIDVDTLTFEQVMGLEDSKQKRLANIEYELRESSFRQELVDIIEQLDAYVRKFDDKGLAYASKSLEDLLKDYKTFNLFDYLNNRFNYSFNKEIAILEEKKVRLRSDIDLTEEKNLKIQNDENLKSIRTLILAQKSDLSRARQRINDLEFKLIDDSIILKELTTKVQTYSNLKFLKKDKLGLLTSHYECPTCKQDVDPKEYDIINLSLADVELSLKLKNSERKAVENSMMKTHDDLVALKEEQLRLIGEIDKNSANFRTLDDTFSQSKKSIIKNALEIGEVETSINRLKDKSKELDKAQSRLADAISKIKNNLSKKELEIGDEDIKKIKKVDSELVRMFEKIKLTAFKDKNSEADFQRIKVVPEHEYRPYLDGKELRRYGSASDQSKIILAYLLAIQSATASSSKSNHIGVTVFDEPFQQNPEEKYVIPTLNFLGEISNSFKGQSIILTHLKDDSEKAARLIQGYNKIEGKRFLKIVG
jgi:hypothetical protein